MSHMSLIIYCIFQCVLFAHETLFCGLAERGIEIIFLYYSAMSNCILLSGYLLTRFCTRNVRWSLNNYSNKIKSHSWGLTHSTTASAKKTTTTKPLGSHIQVDMKTREWTTSRPTKHDKYMKLNFVFILELAEGIFSFHLVSSSGFYMHTLRIQLLPAALFFPRRDCLFKHYT